MARPPVDTTRDAGLTRIVALIEESLDRIVAETVTTIMSQIPVYRQRPERGLQEDLVRHVDAVFRVLLVVIAEQRMPVRSDFSMTREMAYRRVEQGVSLNDFLRAFRIGQLNLWHAVLEGAGEDPDAQGAALAIVDQLMMVIEVGSAVAAEGYLDAQQHQLADRDRVRRDLVEDLLAGQVPSMGAKAGILATAGLERPDCLLVLSAVVLDGGAVDRTLRAAVSAVRGSRGTGRPGLVVTRQDEVVAVLPVPASEVADCALRIATALEELTAPGGLLGVGISTPRAGLALVPEAYDEARAARDALGTRAGVVALPLLSTFDYLVMRVDTTARRLVRPELVRFVEDDAARGGALVTTLLEYVASDLNAKAVAARLHTHTNTVYYRLDRIAELTGSDVRSFAGVLELLIAVRVVGGTPRN